VEKAKALTIDETNQSSSEMASFHAHRSKSTLHVLTLTPFYPSFANEVSGCFIHEPLDHLVQLGLVSTVLAVQPIYCSHKAPSVSAPAHWVRYPQLPGNLGLSSAGWLLSARLLGWAKRLHAERRVDLIHAHAALPCGHAAALLSRRLHVPYVVTVHGLDVFNACREDGVAAQWRRSRSIEVYQNAQVVLCVSAKVQQLLQAGVAGEVRSAVVYNSADCDRFSVASAVDSKAQRNLLAVGNLIPTKGQELILRAMARLMPAFPQLWCQFIGEGADRGRLESLSKELGIAERVEFMGRRTRAEVAEAMQACSVFVLPSNSEGLGCVYLEAMACGKPVIACRGQGIEEIIDHGKNGWLVPPDSLDELATTLSAVLEAPDLSAAAGAAGRETILNRLSLDHQAQALMEVYSEAIQHR